MLSDQTLRKERENVKGQVLGTFIGGILITDFWGACKAIETLAKQRRDHSSPIYARRKAKLHIRLDEPVAAAFEDADARRLIKRLRRHRDEMLAFLDHEGVSPYNNHAEQPMRTAVHTRIVSQQNRSQQGAKTHAIFLSLFRSAQLQRINPVEYVLQRARNEISAQATGTIAPAQFKISGLIVSDA